MSYTLIPDQDDPPAKVGSLGAMGLNFSTYRRGKRHSFLFILLAMFILFASFIILVSLAAPPLHDYLSIRPHKDCTGGLERFRPHLNRTAQIEYSRRTIHLKATRRVDQKSIIHHNDQIMSTFSSDIDLHDSECHFEETTPPVIIEYQKFSPPATVDTSSLIIGASTTLERLMISLPQWARWLGNTNTPIFVNVHGAFDAKGLQEAEDFAKSYKIDATLIALDDSPKDGDDDHHAERHFAIVEMLYSHRRPESKWFCIMDDDTFFPSLPDLLSALSAYDAAQPWYIGHLTESWPSFHYWGYMAYGGAGVFLSFPVLQTLHTHFDECLQLGGEGDELYGNCIYTKSSPAVRLTQLEGLHQMDLKGDLSGWYESGLERPLLSLHHFSGWHKYPVEYGHLVSDLCGSACFLQRYQFGNVVLTNGYSIAQYPNGLDGVDLMTVEATFKHEFEGQYDFSLGSLRPNLSEADKISWRLEFAFKEADGKTVRQFYTRRLKEGEGDEAEVVSVFELVWVR